MGNAASYITGTATKEINKTPKHTPKPLSDLKSPTSTCADVVSALKSAIPSHTVLFPGDEEYERARLAGTWNYDITGSPSVIIVPEDATQVATTLKFLAENFLGADVCVAGGRHSHVHMVNDSITISLHRITGVDIILESAEYDGGPIVHVGGGCKLGDVDAACAPHGMAVPVGHDQSTGVGGLTLQGGHGWLERTLGMTVDSLLAAEVALPSGEVVIATHTNSYSDLLWGLSGGGGNFGIVTKFTFRLHPLAEKGKVLGGERIHLPLGCGPFSSRKNIISRFHERISAAPDEFAANLILTNTPVIEVCFWMGKHDEGEKYFEKNVRGKGNGWPVRDTTNCVVDYYTHVQRVIQGPDGKNVAPSHYYVRGLLLPELTNEAMDALVQLTNQIPSRHCALVLMALGGKAACGTWGAVGHRQARYWLIVSAKFPSGTEKERESIVTWARTVCTTMEAFSKETYGILPACDDMEFLGRAPESTGQTARLEMYFGSHGQRLAEIKAKYDPLNVLHMNVNVAPQAHATAAL